MAIKKPPGGYPRGWFDAMARPYFGSGLPQCPQKLASVGASHPQEGQYLGFVPRSDRMDQVRPNNTSMMAPSHKRGRTIQPSGPKPQPIMPGPIMPQPPPSQIGTITKASKVVTMRKTTIVFLVDLFIQSSNLSLSNVRVADCRFFYGSQQLGSPPRDAHKAVAELPDGAHDTVEVERNDPDDDPDEENDYTGDQPFFVFFVHVNLLVKVAVSYGKKAEKANYRVETVE